MTDKKCPMCDGSCLLKVIAAEGSCLCEVDVCSTCGTMYPRGKDSKPRKEAGTEGKGEC
jgi:hypothetical protein